MFKNSNRTTSGFSYDYRQATIDGSENQEQISAFVTWKKAKGWSTTLAALTGLTDASPDFGVSIYFSSDY